MTLRGLLRFAVIAYIAHMEPIYVEFSTHFAQHRNKSGLPHYYELNRVLFYTCISITIYIACLFSVSTMSTQYNYILKLQVYPEGTHLIIPWYEGPDIYDVRAKPCVVESKAGSLDLQMVCIFPNPVPGKF